ncbi:MAG TPA: Mut7-C RNAse domain-containing protein [Methanotrichaceae archaeon]|nr:Mut7-C RNAse domain-containing protein [Methanotrichaceae archaeon]
MVTGFIVDQMMIRLGRWLRIAGHDVSNPGDADDPELLNLALKEDRTLITRDRGLAEACARAGASCMLIKSDQLEDQLREISSAGIGLEMKPRRCTVCNGPLVTAEEGIRPEHLSDEPAWRCQSCGKVYWTGSHWKRIQQRFEELRGRDQG